ncbi:hypothetical protein CSIRO_2827 [Bradyrhizobiaceae bacterium SG-6C]|nr:hypothetical protein CSIRO_2827 [Bradyrhizobiaceae bacterium SG-6C]
MDHPVAIPPKGAAAQARRLVIAPAPALTGIGAIDRRRGSHSDRHTNYSTFGV